MGSPAWTPSRVRALLGSSGTLTALVVIGILLHAWAYASTTALWLDEILLSSNILSLPLRELLTQPLQLDQVAPRGFLLVEKLAVVALGPNELALRFFPFLDATAAIVLMLLGLELTGRETSRKRLVLSGLFGLVIIWFSQASVIVMAGIAAARAARGLRSE